MLSKLKSSRFVGSRKIELSKCFAFLVENTGTSDLLIGFEEGQENITLKPNQSRPFRANEVFQEALQIYAQTTSEFLIIQEIPVYTENLAQ